MNLEPQLTLEEFKQTMFGCMQFALDKKDAQALVDKGRAWADYFENTVLASYYPQYITSNLPIDIWAIRTPNVILENYAHKAKNKDAFLKAVYESTK